MNGREGIKSGEAARMTSSSDGAALFPPAIDTLRMILAIMAYRGSRGIEAQEAGLTSSMTARSEGWKGGDPYLWQPGSLPSQPASHPWALCSLPQHQPDE
jgi:hypothetical protein